MWCGSDVDQGVVCVGGGGVVAGRAYAVVSVESVVTGQSRLVGCGVCDFRAVAATPRRGDLLCGITASPVVARGSRDVRWVDGSALLEMQMDDARPHVGDGSRWEWDAGAHQRAE